MKLASIARRAMLAAGVLAAAATAAHAQDIKLGFNGDLSASPTAQSGRAVVAGVQAAIDDINAGGGVMGRKLTLVVRDDLAQPSKSIQNMVELIDNEKVAAVFGPTNSGNAMAWKRIPNEKKIVSMQPCTQATDITKPMSPDADNYIFRLSMYDRAQAAGIMSYVKKSGMTKVGLLTETTGYGEGGLRDLLGQAKIRGVTPLVAEKFAVSDTDMTSQLSKMKAAGVETLIVWGQGTPMGLVLRSMEKLNYFPTFLSSQAADNITFFDAAGKSLAARAIFLRPLIAPNTPAQKQLLDRVRAKLAAPSAFIFAMQGYDSTLLLAAAMRQANSIEGPQVREALESLRSPVQGVFRTYTKPFSKSQHEGLTAADAKWAHWVGDQLVEYSDRVTQSLTVADMNR
ncbi:ABC transporter substrate-binding protein [Burkholderia pseudomultivorans]|uniref:Branched-chain amino acid ABC transporter substrate-binding protein n=1 Tax=Burkholderia pseudomultivorans TaxID=1207504 RepID=A0A132E946_9BURK|nr:ABC transporter substrate-binding protein [Burkholderia pseudomultivorans]KWF20568.1 branched-chain amino acid ABC transporter substrate-binding protein [Burkholderia pseudomultivorans]